MLEFLLCITAWAVRFTRSGDRCYVSSNHILNYFSFGTNRAVVSILTFIRALVFNYYHRFFLQNLAVLLLFSFPQKCKFTAKDVVDSQAFSTMFCYVQWSTSIFRITRGYRITNLIMPNCQLNKTLSYRKDILSVSIKYCWFRSYGTAKLHFDHNRESYDMQIGHIFQTTNVSIGRAPLFTYVFLELSFVSTESHIKFSFFDS